MTNIKDLIQSQSQIDFDNYIELDQDALSGWHVDINSIKQSQFIIYMSEENYIDLLQVNKAYSTLAKRIVINQPQNSDVFKQMTQDLQLVEGQLISKELNKLTIESRIKIEQASNDKSLFITILPEQKEDSHNNESNS